MWIKYKWMLPAAEAHLADCAAISHKTITTMLQGAGNKTIRMENNRLDTKKQQLHC